MQQKKLGSLQLCHKIGDVYKLFMVRGQAVPTKKTTKGVMVNVKFEEPVRKIVYRIAETQLSFLFQIMGILSVNMA